MYSRYIAEIVLIYSASIAAIGIGVSLLILAIKCESSE